MEGLVLDFVCLGQGYYLDVFVDFLDDPFGDYVVQAFVLFSSSFLLFSRFLLTHHLALFRRFSLSFSSICLRSGLFSRFSLDSVRNLSSRCFGVSFCCLT